MKRCASKRAEGAGAVTGAALWGFAFWFPFLSRPFSWGHPLWLAIFRRFAFWNSPFASLFFFFMTHLFRCLSCFFSIYPRHLANVPHARLIPESSVDMAATDVALGALYIKFS